MNLYSLVGIFLCFSISFGASLRDVKERKLDKIEALRMAMHSPVNPNGLDITAYVQKLEAEAASGDMLAFFLLGNIYFKGTVLYGPGAPMDWDKASNYLYKAFLDMRGAFYFLLEDLQRCLQNIPIAATLADTARKLKEIISPVVNMLHHIIPTLMKKLIEEDERFRFDMRKEEQQARDEIMLEVFQNSDIPMRLKDLPPQREGGWFTEAEYFRAAILLQGANNPPSGVCLVEWQFDKLKEVFSHKRAEALYYSIINQERLTTKDDLLNMIELLNRIHPDDREELAGYIYKTQQAICTREAEIQSHVVMAKRVEISALIILSLCWLYMVLPPEVGTLWMRIFSLVR